MKSVPSPPPQYGEIAIEERSVPLWYGLLNRSVAFIALFLLSPLFVLAWVGAKRRGDGPLFYHGARMGQGGREFYIYKFRTLRNDAEKRLGGAILTKGDRMETSLGSFLRESRIDELPQLWNIVKGEMLFVGPRPERREIYAAHCHTIEGYSKRFSVKPGLVGISQLFTPHNAPRRVRSLIDNDYISNKQSPLRDVGLLGYAAISLTGNLYRRLVDHFVQDGGVRRKSERRFMNRVQQTGVLVRLTSSRGRFDGELLDLNEESMLVFTDQEIKREELSLSLVCTTVHKGRIRAYAVQCRGEIRSARQNTLRRRGQAYIIRYHSLSTLNNYKLHKYFLKSAVSAH